MDKVPTDYAKQVTSHLETLKRMEKALPQAQSRHEIEALRAKLKEFQLEVNKGLAHHHEL